MSAGRSGFTVPILAVAAVAATLGWFGYRHLRPDPAASGATRSAPATPAAPVGPALSGPPSADRPVQVAGRPDDPAARPAAGLPSAAPSAPGFAPKVETLPRFPGVLAETGRADASPPAFDVVRVEPTGDSVIAGRATPGSTVQLTANGRVLAKVVADPGGLFAFVPLPLSPGSHEIVLEMTGQDGARVPSAQSVTVVIAADRREPPLVTVSAPGEPTVILSRPDAPAAVASAPRPAASPDPVIPNTVAPAPAAPADGAARSASTVAAEPPGAAAPASKRPAMQIASVEAEGSGRLYVSGDAAPGATVRLYLNDTFVAPASAGPDGRLAFTIERGIRPGAYRVRIDDVDPVSGSVRSRAEVGFTMPPQAIAAAGPPAAGSRIDALIGTSPAPAPSAPDRTPGERPIGGGTGPAAAAADGAPRTAGARPPGGTAAGSSAIASAVPAPVPGAGSSLLSPGAVLPSGAFIQADGGQPASVPPAASSLQLTAADPAPGSGPPRSGARDPAVGPAPVIVPEVNTAIVTRGESLWAISKRTYGAGLRYTVIYGANTPQIRDPNRIYPGQVFVLPGTPLQGASR